MESIYYAAIMPAAIHNTTWRCFHDAAGQPYLSVVFLLVRFLPKLPLRVQRCIRVEGGLCDDGQQRNEKEERAPHPRKRDKARENLRRAPLDQAQSPSSSIESSLRHAPCAVKVGHLVLFMWIEEMEVDAIP